MDKEIRDYESLKRGLWYAQRQGYRVPPLELAIFNSAGAEKLQGSLRTWAKGLILSEDFARAVFGSDLYGDNGESFSAIRIWAKQTAVEVADKLYKVQDGMRHFVYVKEPEIDFYKLADSAPTQLMNSEQVVIQLKDMAATIPFRTHTIKEVDVIGGIPAWQYHLREMVIAENPFTYLKDYVDDIQYNGKR